MTNTSKTIVFFGNEKLATGIAYIEPLILRAAERAGFEIEQHVTGKLSELKPHNSQLAVLAAYGHIVPQAVLDQFPLGIINVHPSLLPLYRGSTPIEQAILDGATKTGVSIMRLTAGMDEGPIYKQKTVQLSGHETKAELTHGLQKLGSELLEEVLGGIASGQLQPRQQPHPSRATYTQKLSKADGVLDWTKPAARLEREIRAYSGWPGSRTNIAGKDVIITQAGLADASGPAGQHKVVDKQLLVFASDKSLEIIKLKPAGKAEMTAQAFLAGYGQSLK